MLKVGIIGGGAVGLICAAKLSKNKKYQVDILEKENRVGKKILQTGNGKCNFTNMGASGKYYNSPSFVNKLIKDYSPSIVRDYFFSLGLASYEDEEKRCYPLSDTATSVLDVLRNACKLNGVYEKTSHEVIEVIKQNNGYKVISLYNNDEKVTYEYDYIIICTGGSLKPLDFLKKMNLKFSDTNPSLCAIKANVSGLNGIRTKVEASLFLDNSLVKKEMGEVLFKDGALSGIVMFNLSSFISRNPNYKNGYIHLNLLPSVNDNEFNDFFASRTKILKNSSIELFLIGLFPKVLAQYILKQAKINSNTLISKLTKSEIETIKYLCKNSKFEIKCNYASNNYQVVHGGIELGELDESFQLKKYNNIYVGGEVLNVDGECGGYNLHFAFASGLKICDMIQNKKQ